MEQLGESEAAIGLTAEDAVAIFKQKGDSKRSTLSGQVRSRLDSLGQLHNNLMTQSASAAVTEAVERASAHDERALFVPGFTLMCVCVCVCVFVCVCVCVCVLVCSWRPGTA